MKSPFKFLYAYDLNDKDVFFGRTEETDALFNMVFKTPLLLVYGLSGTGKTSLIKCGLASRFLGPDWLPFFIRRDGNLYHTTIKALSKYLDHDDPEPQKISEAVEAVYDNYLRPVYLIYDQFEEIFILGDLDEQMKMARAIRNLIHAKVPCKVILVMREEFIGQLYHLEKEIPSIYDFRLRVEPMNLQKVKEVILGSFTEFKMQLQASEKNIETIYNNIGSKKSGIQLPYLQVYLDNLWRQDFDRTYSEDKHLYWAEQMAAEPPAYPPLELTTEEINAMGAIENVLASFLKDQRSVIQEELEKNYPNIAPDSVRQILNIFVTPEGTKHPTPIVFHGEQVELEKTNNQFLLNLPKGCLGFVFKRLVDARLLLEREGTLELAHDSLAALIDQERSDEERQVYEVHRRLQNAYDEYKKSKDRGEDFPTSRTLLLDTKEYLDKLHHLLSPELRYFYEDRMADAERRDNEALLEARKEQQLRAKAERNSRIAKWFAALSVLLCIASVISYIKLDLETDAKIKAIKDKEIAEREGFVLDSMAKVEKEEYRRNYFSEKLVEENIARIEDLQYEKAFDEILKQFNYLSQEDQNGNILRVDSLRFRSELEPYLNTKESKRKIAEIVFEIIFYYKEIGTLSAKEVLLQNVIGYLGFDYKNFMENNGDNILDLLDAKKPKKRSMTFEEAWFRRFAQKYFPSMILTGGANFEKGTDEKCENCEPLSTVYVDSVFLGSTEVTNYQYNLFLKSQNRSIFQENKFGILLKGSWPMVNVDWYNALAYCNWLNARFGLPQYYTIEEQPPGQKIYIVRRTPNNGFRIPTESEWEFAAKAGQPDALFAGGDVIDSVGWYKNNSGRELHPVNSKRPNAFGFYDMSGNVAEWCWNWSQTLNADTIKKRLPTRWFRGGAYDTDAEECRVFSRFLSYVPENNWTGFRIARNKP